jgi:hypothetical protein
MKRKINSYPRNLVILLGLFTLIVLNSCSEEKQYLDVKLTDAIINTVSIKLDSFYIDQNKGIRIAESLQDWYQKNQGQTENWEDFVSKTNKQLYASSNDKHLKLYLDFDDSEEDEDYEEEATAIFQSKSDESKRLINEGERLIDYQLKSGISDVRILKNNIGYLALYWIAESEDDREAINEVMLKLKDTEALIIDIGINIGGAPFGVKYYSGFMFEEKTHLSSFIMRGMDDIRERWSINEGIPTESFYDKPIYILSSARTFSAAESFLFGLKNNDRIIQVGGNTAGGGLFGGTYEVSSIPKLDLWVSKGKTFNPKNSESWEAIGISPDINVDYSKALETAASHINGNNTNGPDNSH